MEVLSAHRLKFVIRHGLIYRLSISGEFLEHDCELIHKQLVVPRKFRQVVIKLAHDSQLSAHHGESRTESLIKRYFYWPHMQREIKGYIISCEICQRLGKGRQTKAPMVITTSPSRPFQNIAMDVVRPIPVSASGKTYILTIIDLFSKYLEAYALKKVTSKAIVECLVKFITSYGIPCSILSDNGANLISEVIQNLCHELNIIKINTAPYRPQSNGSLERFHRCLKAMLSANCLKSDIKNWEKYLPICIFA